MLSNVGNITIISITRCNFLMTIRAENHVDILCTIRNHRTKHLAGWFYHEAYYYLAMFTLSTVYV